MLLFFVCSQPPKSTIKNWLALSTPVAVQTCFIESIKIECAREDRWFMAVAALRFLRSPLSNNLKISEMSVTGTSATLPCRTNL